MKTPAEKFDDYRMMLLFITVITIVVGFLMLVFSSTPAEAVECRSTKGDGYWQWRLIENRRCWYPGKRKLEKNKLHWRAPRQPIINVYQWDEYNPIDAMAPERIEDIQKRDFDLRFKGEIEKLMPPYQK